MAETGEDQQALRKIIDFTRYASIVCLAMHFYYYLYAPLEKLNWTAYFVNKIIFKIALTGIFKSIWYSKTFAFVLLTVSLIGAKGKKDEKMKYKKISIVILCGLILYFISIYLLKINTNQFFLLFIYSSITILGYILILQGGTHLSRIIKGTNKDVFNDENETFPQEERLLENEYSINLPTNYFFKRRKRNGWINVINPFRGSIIIGTPGAGKSYFVIRHIIEQHIKKGFSMFIYDFKFEDLTKLGYNFLVKNMNCYKTPPKFYIINFDNLQKSHRCNPLIPDSMTDITDASESAQTILLGLNREWIKKQGDFFVESPINFLTAIIWFLKKYENGKYCTLPHAIELMQLNYDTLFPILGTEPEIEVLINPFLSAYLNGAAEQLEGQIASAKICMARLTSPQIYYVLSGNDFSLDINNPENPKIICLGNNPQKTQTYGAVLSLYITRLIRIVNQPKKLKSSLIFDEFPTIYFNGIDRLIATARSNKVATTLAVQDNSQLKKDYGREQAEVIINIMGNVISGQATGETAKNLSERFGKILQNRSSITQSANDTSISTSTQLEYAIPQSTIGNLSSGEFVGTVADNPEEKIKLKTFHCQIINDHEKIKKEEKNSLEIPIISNVSEKDIQENYYKIKKDIQIIAEKLTELIKTDETYKHLAITK